MNFSSVHPGRSGCDFAKWKAGKMSVAVLIYTVLKYDSNDTGAVGEIFAQSGILF